MDEDGGKIIPDAVLPEVERIVGTWTSQSAWFAVDNTPHKPLRSYPWHIRLRVKFQSWRYDAKWWLHDRLFGEHD